MKKPTSVVEAHMHLFDASKDPDAYCDLLIMTMERIKESISRA